MYLRILLITLFSTMVAIFVCAPAYSGEPFVKTVYKNQNWKVIESGFTGEFSAREIDSSPHYLDKGKNPKYGMTIIKVTQSGKIIFAGENIGAYFKVAGKTTLQIDDTTPIAITPEMPFDAGKTIEFMMKGKEVKVHVDFGSGGVSVYVFKLAGFPDAYKKMIASK